MAIIWPFVIPRATLGAATASDHHIQSPLNDPVEVTDYDPAWSDLFQLERRQICPVLGRMAVAIEHVGSTAVPGLAAKPVLDILVGARPFPLSDDTLAALGTLGYAYRGVRGAGGDQFFRTNPRTRHLHVVAYGGEEWHACLLFREYLRSHPDVAAEYGALKRMLATHYRFDRRRYSEGKAAFLRATLQQAARELADRSVGSHEAIE